MTGTEHTAEWLAIEGSQKWKQNLCKFLDGKGVKMQKTNFRAKGPANKHHLKANEHAWQAVGLGFASFVGKNKCVALKAHETRFTVPMSSLPEALQRKAGACIDEDGAHHRLKPQERPLEAGWQFSSI